MSIENLSSEIKNIFYKEDIYEDVAVEESEEKSPEEEKLTDELAVTLDFDPAMPDEEIFMEFPEFDNNGVNVNIKPSSAYLSILLETLLSS